MWYGRSHSSIQSTLARAVAIPRTRWAAPTLIDAVEHLPLGPHSQSRRGFN